MRVFSAHSSQSSLRVQQTLSCTTVVKDKINVNMKRRRRLKRRMFASQRTMHLALRRQDGTCMAAVCMQIPWPYHTFDLDVSCFGSVFDEPMILDLAIAYHKLLLHHASYRAARRLISITSELLGDDSRSTRVVQSPPSCVTLIKLAFWKQSKVRAKDMEGSAYPLSEGDDLSVKQSHVARPGSVR